VCYASITIAFLTPDLPFEQINYRDAPDAVPPRLMGAIERALRNSATRKMKYIFDPTIGMTFDCVTKAQEFYNIYS
jgi:hypothetical protein